MALRAGDTVWWPGIRGALERVREGCGQCWRNAPSQPMTPPVAIRQPDYPFQLIATDYFAYGGKVHLVIVDRYSGWQVVTQCKSDTAEELVRLLRAFFCTYGTPEEMASDAL